MNAVVTGGTGFIGRVLVEHLTGNGHRVTVLSRRPAGDALPSLRVVHGDLASPECQVDVLVRDCSVLFHCAGEVKDRRVMRALHVDGTKRLLGAVGREAERAGTAVHWVQLSSVGAYGPPVANAAEERIITEETPTRPVGEYETTKTCSDELVMRSGLSGCITYSILRPSNVFGAEMSNSSLRQLAGVIARRRFFYVGPPGAVATYVHVADVVEALSACADAPAARGQVFNLSNDCLLQELVCGLAAALGVPPPRARVPEPALRAAVKLLGHVCTLPLSQQRIDALVGRTRYPFQKIQRELGLAPRVSVPDAMGEIVRSLSRPSSHAA